MCFISFVVVVVFVVVMMMTMIMMTTTTIIYTILSSTECDDGKYGTGCVMTCGQCADGLQCNKSTGVCETGCKPGWEGRFCNEKEIVGRGHS